jgi:hypothetical protein
MFRRGTAPDYAPGGAWDHQPNRRVRVFLKKDFIKSLTCPDTDGLAMRAAKNCFCAFVNPSIR